MEVGPGLAVLRVGPPSGGPGDEVAVEGPHENQVGPGNTFDQNGAGVTVLVASRNRVTGNTITRSTVAGVDLQAGASDNFVVGNAITKNPVGIRVIRAASVRNTFLDNRITANTGKGIDLLEGANHGIRPPELTEFLGDALYGTTDAPDGSQVQVFRDPADEGAQKVGEALVADGKFRVPLALDPLDVGRLFRLNATVTDPVGDTSEFSGAFEGDVPLTRLVWISTRDGNAELYLRDPANPAPPDHEPRGRRSAAPVA